VPASGSFINATANGSFGAWTGSYVDSTFANTTLTLNTSAAPSGLNLSYATVADTALGDLSTDSFKFTTIAANSGLVSFNYNYVADPAGLQSVFSFVLNSSETLIASTASSNSSFSLAVNAGDTFGFRLIDGSPYQFGSGSSSVSITSFSAPVPEPSSLSMLAAGFVGLFGFREIRRRARSAA
jgi:hypothetical protein